MEAYQPLRPRSRPLAAGGWKRRSTLACRPRRRWRKNKARRAPGWKAPQTPICATGCTICDDLSNRLLRILTGQGRDTGAEMPEDPILMARNIGRPSCWITGSRLRGVVLEEGSVGHHAAIVARALAIPLVIHAERIMTEALNGDPIWSMAIGRCASAPRGNGRHGVSRQDGHAGQGAAALCGLRGLPATSQYGRDGQAAT